MREITVNNIQKSPKKYLQLFEGNTIVYAFQECSDISVFETKIVITTIEEVISFDCGPITQVDATAYTRLNNQSTYPTQQALKKADDIHSQLGGMMRGILSSTGFKSVIFSTPTISNTKETQIIRLNPTKIFLNASADMVEFSRVDASGNTKKLMSISTRQQVLLIKDVIYLRVGGQLMMLETDGVTDTNGVAFNAIIDYSGNKNDLSRNKARLIYEELTTSIFESYNQGGTEYLKDDLDTQISTTPIDDVPLTWDATSSRWRDQPKFYYNINFDAANSFKITLHKNWKMTSIVDAGGIVSSVLKNASVYTPSDPIDALTDVITITSTGSGYVLLICSYI